MNTSSSLHSPNLDKCCRWNQMVTYVDKIHKPSSVHQQIHDLHYHYDTSNNM